MEPERRRREGYSCGWDIVHTCNYRCPYCFFIEPWGADLEKMSRRHLACAKEEWLSFWRRLADRYGRFRIEIAGGEPFHHPEFFPLVREISRRHDVRVVTNLSAPVGGILDAFDPAAVSFSASFHPDFAAIKKFTAKLSRLKRAGFTVAASVVAYPPHFERLSGWLGALREAGVACYLNPFQGSFEGRSYPRSYDKKHSALLAEASFADAHAYRMGDRIPRGRPCDAGRTSFRVWPDGRIFRCCGSTETSEEPIGHVRDPEFTLMKEASPCRAGRCFAPNEVAGLL